ncbi:hypothetical protein PG997_015129 [Apiospora hydei]|uniref:Heterokaryon incompatibility domain-containing protein n=1 Tax=Apiospora hydei TaxID=1337664 RepID=A0ABR1UVT3_9PEZI
MPSPKFWTNAGCVLGLAPAIYGLQALFAPAGALAGSGLPGGSTLQDQALAQGLMRIYGVRNVVISLTLFTAWYHGHRGTQGVGLILGALMPFVDGLVFKDLLGGGEWKHWGLLHGSLEDFHSAVRDGCWTCSTLKDSSRQQIRAPMHYAIKRPLLDHFPSPNPYDLQFTFMNPATNVDTRALRLRIDPIPSWTQAHELASRSASQSWSGSADALALVNHWLSDCLRNHPSCANMGSERPWQPTRLLEISEQSVRLVTTSTKDFKEAYGTLSHCWGTDPFLTLTSSTFGRFAAGFPLDELPRSFQEAFCIIQALGIRYLWIDCYCIIQDDRNDWLHEAPLMSKVYSNSRINIGAADASGPRHGIFRERSHDSITIRSNGAGDMESRFFHLSRLGSEGILDLFEDPLDRSFASDVMDHSALMSRGWVIQERALSPRMVTFTRGEVYWQCHESAATECFPVGWLQRIDRLNGDPFWSLSPSDGLLRNLQRDQEGQVRAPDQGATTMEPANAISFQERWFHTLSTYTAAALTYPDKDKILAIDGIGRRLAELSNDTYSRGILGKAMPYALLWRKKVGYVEDALAGCGKAADEVPQVPSSVRRYPTWHWTSYDTVDFRDLIFDKYIRERSQPSVRIMPQLYCFTSDSCTAVPSVDDGDLDLWPHLLCIGRPARVLHLDETESGKTTFVLPDGGTIAYPRWDERQRDHTASGPIYLLPVTATYAGNVKARNSNMGLILVLGRNGKFRRVGMFEQDQQDGGNVLQSQMENTKPRMLVIE